MTREELSRLEALVERLEYNFKHVVDSNERLDKLVNHRFSALERDVADQKTHSRRQSRDIQEFSKRLHQGYDYNQAPPPPTGGENAAPHADNGFYTHGRKSHDVRTGGGKPRGGYRNPYDNRNPLDHRNGYCRGQYSG